MTQHAGRVTCSRCGANNFDNVSECWKCHASLGAPSVAVHPGAHAPFVVHERAVPPAYTPATVSSASGDPGVARRAAIALALTIPFIGLPVGWIFMMIEDERRQAVGRVCAIWSVIALLLQLLLMFAFAQSMGPWITTLVNTAARAAQPPQSPGGG